MYNLNTGCEQNFRLTKIVHHLQSSNLYFKKERKPANQETSDKDLMLVSKFHCISDSERNDSTINNSK